MGKSVVPQRRQRKLASGQSLVEYGLIVALIGVFSIASLGFLGNSISNTLGNLASGINGDGGSNPMSGGGNGGGSGGSGGSGDVAAPPIVGGSGDGGLSGFFGQNPGGSDRNRPDPVVSGGTDGGGLYGNGNDPVLGVSGNTSPTLVTGNDAIPPYMPPPEDSTTISAIIGLGGSYPAPQPVIDVEPSLDPVVSPARTPPPDQSIANPQPVVGGGCGCMSGRSNSTTL